MEFRALICAGCLALVAGHGIAADFYVGANMGIMDVDSSGFDDATNGGVVLGIDYLRLDVFAASLEAEFTTTISDGDVDRSGASGDWDIDTQAVFAAFRLGDPLYIKAKFGGLRMDQSIDTDSGSSSDTNSRFTWGGAVGWLPTDRLAAELSYTMVDSDINYLSLGLHYHFE